MTPPNQSPEPTRVTPFFLPRRFMWFGSHRSRVAQLSSLGLIRLDTMKLVTAAISITNP
jgi:hypothetical protein